MTNNDNQQCGHNRQLQRGMCFNHNDVCLIAKAYKTEYPDDELPNDENEIIVHLENRFSACKRSHRCLLQQPFVRKYQETKALASQVLLPEGPKEPEEWLSTTHINNVLDQFVAKYPDTLYTKAVPSDFRQIPELGIRDLNFAELQKNGTHKIAMVVNTDPSWKSGQHWVAIWINFKKGHVYYWDSVGNLPPKPMLFFMTDCVKYMMERDGITDIGKNYDIYCNVNEIQKLDSQCGVYCINTLVQLMKGRKYRDIIDDALSDKQMEICREYYYFTRQRKGDGKKYRVCH